MWLRDPLKPNNPGATMSARSQIREGESRNYAVPMKELGPHKSLTVCCSTNVGNPF